MIPKRRLIAASRTKRDLRQICGRILLTSSVAIPLVGLVLSLAGWRGMQSPLLAFLLMGGFPEILCLGAIAVVGRRRFLPAGTSARGKPSASASRIRYYAGLTGCFLNPVPVWLYAYTPWLLPGGIEKFILLSMADLVFVSSVLLMGGEFWEKFRRLFVWDGIPDRPEALPDSRSRRRG